MPTYRITNRVTRETAQLDAPYAQDACTLLGWLIGDCYTQLVRETPYTDLTAPVLRCAAAHLSSSNDELP